MECAILTYTVPHRKTYDTLCLLKAKGYADVSVYAIPHHYHKTFCPIYEHRPSICNHVTTEEMCKNFDYKYTVINQYNDICIDERIPILSCGAGIIPEEIVQKYVIINAHPGYIPYVRGLDSLKWAIYEKLPIGVTSHYIGNEVDAGRVIERREIPLYVNDTFHALAQRVYENEVEMLVGALDLMKLKGFYVHAGNNVLHKRMQPEQEIYLMEKFEELKEERGV